MTLYHFKSDLLIWALFDAYERKGYYLYITKRNIQIELIDNGKETVNDIERYLEFLFCNQYIGVSFEGNDNVHLEMKKVKCFYL